jgi:hypothetical protein
VATSIPDFLQIGCKMQTEVQNLLLASVQSGCYFAWLHEKEKPHQRH